MLGTAAHEVAPGPADMVERLIRIAGFVCTELLVVPV